MSSHTQANAWGKNLAIPRLHGYRHADRGAIQCNDNKG